MAAGGVAGGTGEDYVVPGQNALVLETADPGSLSQCFGSCEATRREMERCVEPVA